MARTAQEFGSGHAPVRFFVSNAGRLATVDNWHNAGFGKVVAIYDPQGKLVSAYELADLFPPAAVKAIPHSVSSIHWRGEAAYVREDQRTLYVHAANEGGFLFGLETGRFSYCENHQGKQRCRNSNADDRWHSGRRSSTGDSEQDGGELHGRSRL